jgi:hypothetical protein
MSPGLTDDTKKRIIKKLDTILFSGNINEKAKKLSQLNPHEIKVLFSPDNGVNHYYADQYNDIKEYEHKTFDDIQIIKDSLDIPDISEISEIPTLNVSKSHYLDSVIEVSEFSKSRMSYMESYANETHKINTNYDPHRQKIKVKARKIKLMKQNTDTDLNVRERNTLEDVPCLSPTNKIETKYMPKSIGDKDVTLYTSIKKAIDIFKKKPRIVPGI